LFALHSHIYLHNKNKLCSIFTYISTAITILIYLCFYVIRKRKSFCQACVGPSGPTRGRSKLIPTTLYNKYLFTLITSVCIVNYINGLALHALCSVHTATINRAIRILIILSEFLQVK
jgi:hypothetical protein